MESFDFKKKANKAKKFYDKKNYFEAYNIYNNLYDEDPEKFNKWDKIFFGWSIYYLYCKDCNEDSEEKVEFLTKMSPQENHSKDGRPCIFSLSILNLTNYLIDNGDYEDALEWLERINPNYLNVDGGRFTSNLEKYYNSKSKALLKNEDFDECIELCEEALNKLESPYENGIWFKRRIGLSYKELGDTEEAIGLLKEVATKVKDWYSYRDIAEAYFDDFELDEALKYAISAALAEGKIESKVNLYYLIARILNEKDIKQYASKHYHLTYLIKVQKDWAIDDELENIAEKEGFSEDDDYNSLESELRDFWESYNF